jgi:hypothetical protein
MQNWLDKSSYNALCDSCGRKFKASSLRRRWDGLMVCKEDYEVRHPQDFLRVQREKIAVPWVRPYPSQDTFIYSCNIINSQGKAGVSVAGCAVAGRIASGNLT